MIWALLAGILVGSIPTALVLARLRGIDLMNQGSTNPGTSNAVRLGGPGLGATILLTEIAKGAFAVWLGARLGGDAGAALGGGGATLGNVYNPWLGFRGGKGLGITAGTLLAAWPALLGLLAIVIAGSLAVFRRSGPASLMTLAAYLMAALAGVVVALPGTWLVVRPGWMLLMAALGIAAMAPKHLVDTLKPRDPHSSPR